MMKGGTIAVSSITNTSSSSDPWYLVHCKHRKELYAANALRNLLSLFVFVPESQTRSLGEMRSVPFFPGYIFARVDLQKIAASQINTCPGVLRLVEFGGDPQPVPHSVIETISEQLENLNTGNVFPHHSFCPGDLVRVKHGPLQDLEMVFVGPTTPSKRVSVLLSILGRLKEVQVDVDTLEKMPGKSDIQLDLDIRWGRRVQGKGRKMERLA